ncbi:uncharacterized protein LOC131952376 [Physella acuta]|uniref:uncharacterized protein LOC131952376 n=1 Tax=Physella acuta TaxID=109671 RepID=UPI0027DDA594|nr:uncharacterized protein LOC131952376 [Physella acuta]
MINSSWQLFCEMDRISSQRDFDFLAEFQHASANFLSNPISAEQSIPAFANPGPMSSPGQVEFRSLSAFTHPLGTQYSSSYELGVADRYQTPSYTSTFIVDDAFSPLCQLPGHPLGQQYPVSLPSPTSPMLPPKHSSQSSPMIKVQRQSPQLSHLQSKMTSLSSVPSLSPQNPSIFSSQNSPLYNSPLSNASYPLSSNQCSQRNDPPLGNMHMSMISSSFSPHPYSSQATSSLSSHRVPSSKVGTREDNSYVNHQRAVQQRDSKISGKSQNPASHYSPSAISPHQASSSSSSQQARYQLNGSQRMSQTMAGMSAPLPSQTAMSSSYPHHRTSQSRPAASASSSAAHNSTHRPMAKHSPLPLETLRKAVRDMSSYSPQSLTANANTTSPYDRRDLTNGSGCDPYAYNAFSIFSLNGHQSNPSQGRGVPAGGRGRGSELMNPAQWYKSPESSYQSDIEAMQADAAESNMNSHLRKSAANASLDEKPIVSHVGVEKKSGISASKAAALAAIQKEQEMVDSINKAKIPKPNPPSTNTNNSVPLKSSEGNKQPARGVPEISNQVSSQNKNSNTNTFSSSNGQSVGQVRNTTTSLPNSGSTPLSNGNKTSRPASQNSLSAILSGDSFSDAVINPQTNRSMTTSIKTRPSNSLHSDTDGSQAMSICQPTEWQKTHNIGHVESNSSRSSSDGPKPDDAQSQASSHSDRKTLAAREKVFNMWKAGQVVGRSPVVGRGKTKGSLSTSPVRLPPNPQAPAVVNHHSPARPGPQDNRNMECSPQNNNRTGVQNMALKNMRYVMFHGHKLICLISCNESVLLFCQFQFECFPDKGMGSINNCIDRALRIKKKCLDHPDKERIIAFLKQNGYSVSNSVQTINLDDARRVYHHMYKITSCSPATCVVELSEHTVDLDTVKLPSRKRALAREMMMGVKKEKSSDDTSYGRYSPKSSRMSPVGAQHWQSGIEDLTRSLVNPSDSTLTASAAPEDTLSLGSDHTEVYGQSKDLDRTQDVILVEAIEDPYKITWTPDTPKTGGLCNTMVGQLRSYRHQGENYLVVEDLCKIFTSSEFYDSVEKENIILYSCCPEIASFLSSIHSSHPPLKSLRQSLVKEKDIGVHITDDNYLSSSSELGAAGKGLAKICKQEILEHYASSPKRRRLDTSEGEEDMDESLGTAAIETNVESLPAVQQADIQDGGEKENVPFTISTSLSFTSDVTDILDKNTESREVDDSQNEVSEQGSKTDEDGSVLSTVALTEFSADPDLNFNNASFVPPSSLREVLSLSSIVSKHISSRAANNHVQNTTEETQERETTHESNSLQTVTVENNETNPILLKEGEPQSPYAQSTDTFSEGADVQVSSVVTCYATETSSVIKDPSACLNSDETNDEDSEIPLTTAGESSLGMDTASLCNGDHSARNQDLEDNNSMQTSSNDATSLDINPDHPIPEGETSDQTFSSQLQHLNMPPSDEASPPDNTLTLEHNIPDEENESIISKLETLSNEISAANDCEDTGKSQASTSVSQLSVESSCSTFVERLKKRLAKRPENSDSRAALPSTSATSTVTQASRPAAAPRFRSFDDLELMTSTSKDPLAAAPGSETSCRKELLAGFSKLRNQNKALINILHILRKELAITKESKEKLEKDLEKCEHTISYMTRSFSCEKEPTIVIDDDD